MLYFRLKFQDLNDINPLPDRISCLTLAPALQQYKMYIKETSVLLIPLKRSMLLGKLKISTERKQSVMIIFLLTY